MAFVSYLRDIQSDLQFYGQDWLSQRSLNIIYRFKSLQLGSRNGHGICIVVTSQKLRFLETIICYGRARSCFLLSLLLWIVTPLDSLHKWSNLSLFILLSRGNHPVCQRVFITTVRGCHGCWPQDQNNAAFAMVVLIWALWTIKD